MSFSCTTYFCGLHRFQGQRHICQGLRILLQPGPCSSLELLLFQPWPFKLQPHLTSCSLSSGDDFSPPDLCSRCISTWITFPTASRPGDTLFSHHFPWYRWPSCLLSALRAILWTPLGICAYFIQAEVPQHCNSP